MSDWSEFTAAFLIFYASHMIPARPAIRDGLTVSLGEPLVSASLCSPLDHPARLADRGSRQGTLCPALGAISLAKTTCRSSSWFPPVCWRSSASERRGGLSLGSRSKQPFDPARPGIAAITRHPLLWALTLWSLAHLAPNGDLAHGLLFGSFALTALLRHDRLRSPGEAPSPGGQLARGSQGGPPSCHACDGRVAASLNPGYVLLSRSAFTPSC